MKSLLFNINNSKLKTFSGILSIVLSFFVFDVSGQDYTTNPYDHIGQAHNEAVLFFITNTNYEGGTFSVRENVVEILSSKNPEYLKELNKEIYYQGGDELQENILREIEGSLRDEYLKLVETTNSSSNYLSAINKIKRLEMSARTVLKDNELIIFLISSAVARYSLKLWASENEGGMGMSSKFKLKFGDKGNNPTRKIDPILTAAHDLNGAFWGAIGGFFGGGGPIGGAVGGVAGGAAASISSAIDQQCTGC